MPSSEIAPTPSQLERYRHDLLLDFPDLEVGLVDFMLFLYQQKTLHSTKTNNDKVYDGSQSLGDDERSLQ